MYCGTFAFFLCSCLGVFCSRFSVEPGSALLAKLIQDSWTGCFRPGWMVLTGGIFLGSLWLSTCLFRWAWMGICLIATKSFLFSYVFSLYFFLGNQIGFSAVCKAQLLYGLCLWTGVGMIVWRKHNINLERS